MPNLTGYDLTISVANLDDIIRSKEYADRAKDWRALDAYYEARAVLAEQGDGGTLGADDLWVDKPPPGHEDDSW